MSPLETYQPQHTVRAPTQATEGTRDYRKQMTTNSTTKIGIFCLGQSKSLKLLARPRGIEPRFSP